MKPTRNLRLMLASAAFFSLASSAFALDGADVVAKLNAAYASSGGTLSYDSLDTVGGNIKITGAKVSVPDRPEKLVIGDVTMEDVEEDGEGGYSVGSITFPNINFTQEGATITAQDLSLDGVTIPADATKNTIDSFVLYDSANAGPVTVTARGVQVFSMSSAVVNLTRQDNDAGFDFDATLSDIKADLSQIDDAKSKDAIRNLGLEKLSGEITMNGSWEVATGNIALDEYAFDFTDVGRLALSVDLSGYTLEFIKALQEATKAQQSNPNKEEANQAMGLAMMGLMQQMTFNGASIRFDDASITRKVLDYVGAQQGISGDQMAQSLKGLLPFMLAQLNIPELQNEIVTAVNAYLDDPKSLTVSAEPAKPVPFPMILGAAMARRTPSRPFSV